MSEFGNPTEFKPGDIVAWLPYKRRNLEVLPALGRVKISIIEEILSSSNEWFVTLKGEDADGWYPERFRYATDKEAALARMKGEL